MHSQPHVHKQTFNQVQGHNEYIHTIKNLREQKTQNLQIIYDIFIDVMIVFRCGAPPQTSCQHSRSE